MIRNLKPLLAGLMIGFLSQSGHGLDWSAKGHAKYLWQQTDTEQIQLGAATSGEKFTDHFANSRYAFKGNHQNGMFDIHGDFGYFKGDTTALSNELFGDSHSQGIAPSDNRRLFDLTYVLSSGDDSLFIHRLDRLSVGYRSQNTVIKFGRQVISWGNGLLYNPMDFFNPFSPNAIDKEYKIGDDMLYAQQLFSSGADLQITSVFRRDESGDLDSSVNSYAAKYHAFIGNSEIDLLISQHYDDTIWGAGASTSLWEGVLRGDIMLTQTDIDHYFSTVSNYSYSWNLWTKNMTGLLEYYYNGFGLSKQDYTPIGLAEHQDLRDRIIRGELFSLGQHNLAASLTVELTPLWQLTPNIFYDYSAATTTLQLTSQYSLANNGSLLFAFYQPFGENDIELIDPKNKTPPPKTNWVFYSQIAWYF